MTCRCPMCGHKNAGRLHRGSYVAAGVVCDEGGVGRHGLKRAGRRQRRVRENRQVSLLVAEFLSARKEEE